MTVAQQRDAVTFLAAKGSSVRRACLRAQLPRATVHDQARPRPAAAALRADIAELAQDHPRDGYRRVGALLRRKRTINRKRVHRLWKRARLQVTRAVRRRPRRNRPAPQSAAYPNQVGAYDFVEDAALDGSVLRMLTVMDEFTFLGTADRRRHEQRGGTGAESPGGTRERVWRASLCAQRYWTGMCGSRGPTVARATADRDPLH